MKAKLSYSHYTYPNSTTCVQYEKSSNTYYEMDITYQLTIFAWCLPKPNKQKAKTAIQSPVREKACTKSQCS